MGKGCSLLNQKGETLIKGPLHPGTVLGSLHQLSHLLCRTIFIVPILFYFMSFFFFFFFFRASPVAYGGSQARGLIGAIAADLRNSHSNSGFKLHLQPTP